MHREAYIPGAHKKNEIEYQKDIDRFVKYVLNHCLSVLRIIDLTCSILLYSVIKVCRDLDTHYDPER